MRAETDTEAEAAPARASTVRAIATMAVIALVAVIGVVGWARLGGGDDPAEADGLTEAVPSQMVGGRAPGDVPGHVATAIGDAPVVGVASLDKLPAEVEEQCNNNFGPITWDQGEPSIEYAYATPDSISASLVGAGEMPGDMGKFGGPGGDAERFRLVCTATDSGGGWTTDNGHIEPIVKGEDFGHFGGGGYSCCDEEGLASASGSVQVPPDAAWALQDRNGWYLAYPVDESPSLTLTWKFRENRFGPGVPPQSAITFVDDDGSIIGEDFVGGGF